MRKLTLSFLVAVLFLPSCKEKVHYEYPFQNPDLSIDERVENLLSLLTPDEKIGLMMNGEISIDRLGIPAYNWWSEACHGICADNATVFPQAIALAATFDVDQQYEIYSAISDEARAHWNTTNHMEFGKTIADAGWWQQGLSFWCPNVNIFRDPRWGRGQETSGEDPYLSSVMGAQVVRGMQGDNPKYYKTHTCAKHYAVHSGPEPLRHQFNIPSVSGRDLWETYLPAFKTLVDADVREVMCAYHRFEGEPCCASNRLLQDILRNKWNYKGFVVSDCGAIDNFFYEGRHGTHPDGATASADGVLSGTDLECGWSYSYLGEAMSRGLISEADIDVSLRRVLRGRFELGTLDPVDRDPWRNLGLDDMGSPEHAALALKAARESMVLLKNNGILPLSKDVRKIAVVGPNADNADMHLGNYNGYPKDEYTLSILDAIKIAAPDAEVIYEKGCELAESYTDKNIVDTFNDGKGFHADYYGNTDFSGEPVVSKDYKEIKLMTFSDGTFEEGVDGKLLSACLTGTLTPDFTGNVYYNVRTFGRYKMTVNGELVDEQTERPWGAVQRPRPESAKKSFKVESGKTYEVKIEYREVDSNANSFLDVDFCRHCALDFASVVSKASSADVIIMVSGISARLEGEEMPVDIDGFNGGDRTRIELPDAQRELLAALDATGKPVVLVNCTGSAVGFGNDEDHYDALLQAWYAGQAAGTAVADVLFGRYNPAGRLPVTFYAYTSQLPHFEDYDMSGRTYRYYRGQPLYPFGYGLSYTEFQYGDAVLSKNHVKAGKGVSIIIPVSNVGEVDGEEVVQVYVKNLDKADVPIKSLKGFKRVPIKAGESVKVKVDIFPDAFEYYDESIDGLSVFPGHYQILYGSSSDDDDLKVLPFEVL